MSDTFDLITATDVIETHGRVVYETMLVYACHHTDDHGLPYWTGDEYRRLVGLIEREEKGRP
jgi:hypothetical protein